MQPSKVHAQFTPNYQPAESVLETMTRGKLKWLTLVNNWAVKRGNAAATADRIKLHAANAEALYVLKSI